MVVAQLVERLLLTPEIGGSIPTIAIFIACQLYWNDEIKDTKRPGMAHIVKECFRYLLDKKIIFIHPGLQVHTRLLFVGTVWWLFQWLLEASHKAPFVLFYDPLGPHPPVRSPPIHLMMVFTVSFLCFRSFQSLTFLNGTNFKRPYQCDQ